MIIYFITAVIQYSGIILTLWFIYKDYFKKGNDNGSIPADIESNGEQ